MGLLSNKIDKKDLKPGDHIYSWRSAYIYAHHGIYIGEEKVIHFTRGAGQEVGTGTVLDRIIFSSSPSPLDTPCVRCGDQCLDGVISSCLDCFLSGGDLYLFHYGVSPTFFLAKARGGTCTLATCDPVDHVLHRASYLLQNGFGVYHIFKNNCEDFAIYCKTGLLVITSISVGRSGQAASFLAAASAIISSPLRFLTTSFTGLTAVAGGMYCVSRFVSDIGMRRDVAKVPVESLIGEVTIDEAMARTEERVTHDVAKVPVESLIGEVTIDEAMARTEERATHDVAIVPVESLIGEVTIDEAMARTEERATHDVAKVPVESLIGEVTIDEAMARTEERATHDVAIVPVESLIGEVTIDEAMARTEERATEQ